MNAIVASVEQAVAIVLLLKAAALVVQLPALPAHARELGRRVGPAAAGLVLLVALPSIAALVWPTVGRLLVAEPHVVLARHEYWRLVGTVLIQSPGPAGVVFNLGTLALVAVLAVSHWGGLRSILLFLACGAALAALAVAYGVTSSGSSGATFALAATICGAGLVRTQGRTRLACATAIAFGGAIWFLGNVHGLAIVAGALIAAVPALLARAGPHPAAPGRPRPRPSALTP